MTIDEVRDKVIGILATLTRARDAERKDSDEAWEQLSMALVYLADATDDVNEIVRGLDPGRLAA